MDKALWKSIKVAPQSVFVSSRVRTGEWLDRPKSDFGPYENIIDAMLYSSFDVLAKMVVRGNRMKVLRAYEWTKADSVALAIFASELVLELQKHPKDDRAKKAIDAAKSNSKSCAEAGHAAADAAYDHSDYVPDAAANCAFAAAASESHNGSIHAARAVEFAIRAGDSEEIRKRCHAFVVERLAKKEHAVISFATGVDFPSPSKKRIQKKKEYILLLRSGDNS